MSANYPSELPAASASREARRLSSLVIADCFMGGDSESVVSCLGSSPGFSAPAAVGGYSFWRARIAMPDFSRPCVAPVTDVSFSRST